jgi:hypothetical protein
MPSCVRFFSISRRTPVEGPDWTWEVVKISIAYGSAYLRLFGCLHGVKEASNKYRHLYEIG